MPSKKQKAAAQKRQGNRPGEETLRNAGTHAPPSTPCHPQHRPRRIEMNETGSLASSPSHRLPTSVKSKFTIRPRRSQRVPIPNRRFEDRQNRLPEPAELDALASESKPHRSSRRPISKPTHTTFEQSRSTLARLPAEILHLIFKNSKPRDVAQMGLVCTCFAEIGIYHLVAELHLIFTSSSFERMRQISRHPIVSQTVTSLYYEADILRSFSCYEDWENYLLSPDVRQDFSNAAPGPPIRKRKPHLQQILHVVDRGSLQQLQRAYIHYREYLADQATIVRHDYNSELLRDAFSKFPNLRSVHLIREGPLLACSRYLVREFEAGLQVPYNVHRYQEKYGVSQLQSILLAAVSTGRSLDNLECDQIHWTFFAQKADVLAKIHPAVRRPKSLELTIGICGPDDESRYYVERFKERKLAWSTKHLKQGHIPQFISAAPDLQNLAIEDGRQTGSNHFLGSPLSIGDVVGTHHWQYLERVTFKFLSASEEDLLGFCTRHAKTLTHLSLHQIELSSGCWQRVFQHMRMTLHLKRVEISGHLSSKAAGESLDLDPPYSDELWTDPWRKSRLQAAIEAYLLEGGDGEPICLDPQLYHVEDDLPRITFPEAHHCRKIARQIARAEAQLLSERIRSRFLV